MFTWKPCIFLHKMHTDFLKRMKEKNPSHIINIKKPHFSQTPKRCHFLGFQNPEKRREKQLQILFNLLRSVCVVHGVFSNARRRCRRKRSESNCQTWFFSTPHINSNRETFFCYVCCFISLSSSHLFGMPEAQKSGIVINMLFISTIK